MIGVCVVGIVHDVLVDCWSFFSGNKWAEFIFRLGPLVKARRIFVPKKNRKTNEKV